MDITEQVIFTNFYFIIMIFLVSPFSMFVGKV